MKRNWSGHCIGKGRWHNNRDCAICRSISTVPASLRRNWAQRDGNQRIRHQTYAQVRELSHFANGFLIGSALMAHDDFQRRRASGVAG
ncbi:hypothetical protein ACNKHM_29015 [Shigella sonnei]